MMIARSRTATAVAAAALSAAFVLAACFLPAAEARADDVNARLAELLSRVDPEAVPSGILADRMVPLAGLEELDGSAGAPATDAARWRQAYYELRGAALDAGISASLGPDVNEVRVAARRRADAGVVPLVVLDARYQRIRRDALANGTLVGRDQRLVPAPGHVWRDALESERAFAAASLVERTAHGADVRFALDAERYLTNIGNLGGGGLPAVVWIDFDDGLGARRVALGEEVAVHYAAPGEKTIRLRAADRAAGAGAGSGLRASFPFLVQAMGVPAPDDTIAVTATVPYEGVYGTGQAYVYLASGHAALANPLVVIEGFDLDNTYDWDDLYLLLNQENLLETLHSDGFDAVVLDFTDATDALQRNAYVVTALIQDVLGRIDPEQQIVVAGASMGGLLGRYALAWMESMGIEHRTRTFVSFDAPQEGANVPLGLQYWLGFFSGLSSEAQHQLELLDKPGARQMLVYHHTDPPTGTGQPDSLRGVFLADLAAVGSYPTAPRIVAAADGSGFMTGQGFAPGEQVIDYEYSSLLVDITGNVWAVPDGGTTLIFYGLIDIIFTPPDSLPVTVSGTAPYDNCPGGYRTTFAQMDTTTVPYGDIVALYDNHDFIPTVSALDIDTADLFYDVDGDPDLLSHTPFQAVYYPHENQEHVFISAESAAWLLDEIIGGATGVASGAWSGGSAGGTTVLYAVRPNPFRGETSIRFDLARRGPASLRVFDVSGREVATLAEGDLAAGRHQVTFRAPGAGSGVYFYRLETPQGKFTGKLTQVR